MADNTPTVAVIKAIVSGQKAIIGPLALEQANKVQGLHVSSDLTAIDVSNDGKTVIENLVLTYKKLFGEASVMACKEAIKEKASSVSSKDLPAILQ